MSSIFLSVLQITAVFYKSPPNLNVWFNTGFISFFFIILQWITGFFLSIHYIPNMIDTHEELLNLCSNSYFYWWMRSLHANGASMLFLVVYIHMGRGFYYASYLYPRQYVWYSGSLIYISLIITAFLGYVLPWGQMSFWGAMVITQLIGSIPVIGGDLVYYLWGGFTVNTSTLKRFYILHILFAGITTAIIIKHLALLHEYGSTNPFGLVYTADWLGFMKHLLPKDFVSLIIVLYFFICIIFFFPEYFGNCQNFIKSNPFITPPHIVPEWYFLPFYGILRSIPHKFLGLVAIIIFFISFFLIPTLGQSILKGTPFRPIYSLYVVWVFFDFVGLGWIGASPVIYPFYEVDSF